MDIYRMFLMTSRCPLFTSSSFARSLLNFSAVRKCKFEYFTYYVYFLRERYAARPHTSSLMVKLFRMKAAFVYSFPRSLPCIHTNPSASRVGKACEFGRNTMHDPKTPSLAFALDFLTNKLYRKTCPKPKRKT